MTKTKKLLTILITCTLALLTLFTGILIPTKAEEPEGTTKQISVLDTGAVSFLIYYDGDPNKVDNVNTADILPEEGITSYDQAVAVKSNWAGDMGLWAIHLYIMVDLTGTPYENFNSVTIELTGLELQATVEDEATLDEVTGEPTIVNVTGKNYAEEYNLINKNFMLSDGSENPPLHGYLVNGAFKTTIEKEEVDKRITLYNDKNIFESVMAENDAFSGESDIPPLNADVNVTFNFACYVEIDEEKIGSNEENGEGTPEDKVETWLNETGDKISAWINKNTGVAVGGTSGLLLLVAGVIIVIKLIKKRR